MGTKAYTDAILSRAEVQRVDSEFHANHFHSPSNDDYN